MEEWRFIVKGDVQGVYFRARTHMLATKLGLAGYAKNEPDGTVAVVAVGPKDKLTELYEFLKAGPELAKVINVELQKSDRITESFTSFDVR